MQTTAAAVGLSQPGDPARLAKALMTLAGVELLSRHLHWRLEGTAASQSA